MKVERQAASAIKTAGHRPEGATGSGKEVKSMAQAKRYRSAISGRYVTRSTAARHKRTTVAESTTKIKGRRKR